MLDNIIKDSKKDLEVYFNKIEEIEEFNSKKVLDAFIENSVCESDFNSATGYGYNDIGRDKIERVYASIFKTEDALVRSQFISGTHAISTCLFALLRPGDTLLSISGKPYDTLDSVIGFNNNSSSLKAFNINYMEVNLVNDDFDYEKIEERLNKSKIKLIEIQRSKGYSTRKSISNSKIKKVVDLIRNYDKDVIIMVDNCYCEFVDKVSPIEMGADIIVGSLIKNLGGGIAPNGAYIAGKKRLVDLAGERLTLPGEGREVGPTLGINKQILEGLFFSPSVVASALKTAVLASKVLEELGYKVEPRYNDERVDIVQNIEFGNEEDLVKYCQGIQMASPVDSFAIPMPWDMPGYEDKVIMAAGTFTQGSSIELSCDGPIRKPYIAYMQGSLTYEYGKIAIIKSVSNLTK